MADGTSSKAVTGLDSNTDYIFKAYSNNSCSTELAAGASVPTLPPQAAKPTLTVNLGSGRVRVSSSVTGTAALSKWQYKKKKDSGNYDTNWSDIGSTSKTLAHTLGGLTDGSAYEFKVRARNASGFGEESSESDAATLRAPTLTPSAVEAKSATLTIANYSPNWRYKYTSPSGGQCSSAVSGTTASPTDLSSGTNYTFKAYGDNSCSTPLATASSFLTKPGKVTNVRATGTHRSISMNWSAATGAASYKVQWKSGAENWDTTRQATSTTASALLTNLTSGTEYTVRVMATNATGDGAWSDDATATPANALLEVRNITANSATLAISNYAEAWWYQGSQQGAACTAVAKGTNTASLTGLTPVSSYTYTAYGVSDCASQTLAAVNFTTTEATGDFDDTDDSDDATPLAPSRPTAAPGDASVTLSWTPGGDGGAPITEWQYQQQEGAQAWGPWTAIPGSGADTTRHTVTSLVNGTTYRFRVRAVNGNGDGAPSPESDAVVPRAANGVAFGDAVEDQTFRQNSPIEPLVLPAATGGDGALTYALTPDPPDGLVLDAATRTLSGTPTAALPATTYTWTATDADGDAAATTFTITVAADLAPTFGDATVADASYIQDSAIEPLVLPAATGGDGALAYTLTPEPPAGLVLDPATMTLSGTPTAALPATTFTWTATDADGDAATLSFTIAVEADRMPSFGDARVGDQSYPQGLAIEPLTLPLATGGNGDLTHALTPEPPAGLHFDAATRSLSGTPAGAHPATTYSWTATDADGDATELLFTIAVPADLAPSFGGAHVADLRLTNNRAMTPLALPAATGGDGRLTYALSPELPDGLRFDPLTRTLAGTPREILAPRAYEYTATDADPSEPDVASLTFTIEVAVSEARRAVLNDALAAQGRALLTGATDAIGERFRASPATSRPEDGRADAALDAIAGFLAGAGGTYDGRETSFTPTGGSWAVAGGPDAPLANGHGFFGGQPFSAGAPSVVHAPHGPGNMPAGSDAPKLHWGYMLDGQSFAMPLDAAGDGGDDGAPGRWTLWGAASAQRFDGQSDAGGYDGGVTSLYLGADARVGDWLAGAALATSRGEADYVTVDGPGRLETELTAVHPYVRGETASGTEFWAVAGVGAGEAEHRPDQRGAVADAADLSMHMGAAGLRRRVGSRGALDFSVVGGAGYLSLSTEGGMRAVDGLDAAVTQGRLALELSRSGTFAPYLQVGARADGGDGETGGGLELVAGLRYAGERVDFEARVRGLAARSDGDHEEYGGMARLEVRPREDGSGLRLSLAPSWGATGFEQLLGEGEGLLGGGNAGAAMYGPGAPLMPPTGMSLDAKVGYGFALERGLLTLGADHTRDPFGVREIVGLAWRSDESAPGIWRGWSGRVGYEAATAFTDGGPNVELVYAIEF